MERPALFTVIMLLLVMPKIFMSYFIIISLDKDKNYKFQPKDQFTRLYYSIMAMFLFFWYGDRIKKSMKLINNYLGTIILAAALFLLIGHLMSDKII